MVMVRLIKTSFIFISSSQSLWNKRRLDVIIIMILFNFDNAIARADTHQTFIFQYEIILMCVYVMQLNAIHLSINFLCFFLLFTHCISYKWCFTYVWCEKQTKWCKMVQITIKMTAKKTNIWYAGRFCALVKQFFAMILCLCVCQVSNNGFCFVLCL